MNNSNGNRKKLFDFENYERPSFFKRIKLRWDHEWKYIPHNIKYGIENIFSWFAIIWNDRDWDQGYLFNIMIHKIDRMEAYNDEHRYTESSPDKVKYLKLTKELLKRVSDEYYFNEYHKYHKIELYEVPYVVPSGLDKTDFGFHNDENLDDFVRVETEVVEDNLDEYFEKYPRELELLLDEKPKYDITDPEWRGTIALYLGRRMQNKAKRLLFKILEEKVESWWV